MDYSELSDKEIAEKIAIIRGMKIIDSPVGRQSILHPKTKAPCIFDPCNLSIDAWPIIVESRIAIKPGDTGNKWAAQHGDWDFAASHENPLRAAMIVFLMMHETS